MAAASRHDSGSPQQRRREDSLRASSHNSRKTHRCIMNSVHTLQRSSMNSAASAAMSADALLQDVRVSHSLHRLMYEQMPADTASTAGNTW